jgi:hypothetical protein
LYNLKKLKKTHIMKKLVLSALALGLATITNAQNLGNLQWANSMGSVTSFDYGLGIVANNPNEIYSVGTFRDTLITTTLTTIDTNISKGAGDIFITKKDSAGNTVWVSTFAGSVDDREVSITSNVSSANFIYITGVYATVAYFNTATGLSSIGTNALNAVFFAKINAQTGKFEWVKQIENAATPKLKIDANNNLYLQCSVYGSMDLNPDPLLTNTINSPAGGQAIVKLDTNGNYIWASVTEKTAPSELAIAPNGNIYCTGTFYDIKVDLNPSTAAADTFYLTTNQFFKQNGFILALNSSGNFLWAKKIGSNYKCYVPKPRIAIDNNSNAIVSGYYSDTIAFNTDDNVSNVHISLFSTYDNYLIQISSAGNFNWVKTFGTSFGDYTYAVTVDNSNNIYTTGYTSAPLDVVFDSLVVGASTNSANSADNGIGYVVKRNSQGDYLGHVNVNDVNTYGISIDGNKDMYITGYVSISTDFDCTPATYNIFPNNGDAFTAKYSFNNVVTGVKNNKETTIAIYPNPTSNIFTITANNPLNTIVVTDIIGKVVLTKNSSNTTETIDITGLQSGVYFVNTSGIMQKIIKE